MVDEEAKEYIEEIYKLLRAHNIEWIIEQVEEKISLGKMQSKKIDASEPVVDAVTQAQRRSTRKNMTEFLFTVPYTEVEKLKIIVEAIELAIISTAKMEKETHKNIISDKIILFGSDELEPQFEHKMRSEHDEKRNIHIGKLSSALISIKDLI